MSETNRTIEAYEDNAGGLHLFTLDETNHGPRPAWGADDPDYIAELLDVA